MSRPPEPVVYAQPSGWAAAPDNADPADTEFEGTRFPEAQASAPTDVFFVHPTSFVDESRPNATLEEPAAQGLLKVILRHQASVFNHVGRVYAPRYRQASGTLFFTGGEPLRQALELAYQDVRSAFVYFLEELNGQRPFFIASHSQGSCHAVRLLSEFQNHPAVHSRLIAAYTIGYPIPRARAPLPPAQSSEDTGALIGFMSFAEGASTEVFVDGFPDCTHGNKYPAVGSEAELVQVNPLTWVSNNSPADAAFHQGGTPMSDLETMSDTLVRGVTGAQVDRVLRVDPTGHPGFTELVIGDGNYHNYDYHLFYENLRVNAWQRYRAFLAREGEGALSKTSDR